MNMAEIAPTKTNLFDYKAQLIFSIDGHSLLEEKREVLVMHLTEIISQIKTQREKLNMLLADSFKLLKLVQVEMGEFELEKLVQGRIHMTPVEVKEKGIMGVTLPDIKYKAAADAKMKPGVSFSGTTNSFDNLSRNMHEVMSLIITVSQVEASAWRLAYEIKKTQRRVNALENVFIPDFREIIKFIQDTLEERERETFFQMKKLKKAHESAKG
jgi:V/A-type H+/Na+-transporting ATPase subunit D